MNIFLLCVSITILHRSNENCKWQQLTQLNVCWNRAYRKPFSMNEWMSVKELQVLCGRLDFMRTYDQRKLVFWSRISRTKSVVMQACYGILSMSREFNLLTSKYDVITEQCNVCDIRENVFTNFHNTVTSLLS